MERAGLRELVKPHEIALAAVTEGVPFPVEKASEDTPEGRDRIYKISQKLTGITDRPDVAEPSALAVFLERPAALSANRARLFRL